MWVDDAGWLVWMAEDVLLLLRALLGTFLPIPVMSMQMPIVREINTKTDESFVPIKKNHGKHTWII